MSKIDNKLQNYSVIPNDLIRDNTLSSTSRFIFCWMASMPRDWEFYRSYMQKELNLSGDTIHKYLDELINAGWIIKGKQDNSGKFGAVAYVINDKKIPSDHVADGENFRDGKKPYREKAVTEKTATRLNIDNILNKDFIENKDRYIENTRKKESITSFSFIDELISLGVSEETATTWQAVRHSKGKLDTKEAFEFIKYQIQMCCNNSKASPEGCVKYAISQSWSSFEYEWWIKGHYKTDVINNKTSNEKHKSNYRFATPDLSGVEAFTDIK